jgi:hypothetical protein
VNTDDLRTLLSRDDVLEAAARAEFNADQDPEYLIAWDQSLNFVSKAYRDRVRAGFAAVLELAGLTQAREALRTAPGDETGKSVSPDQRVWALPAEPGPDVRRLRPTPRYRGDNGIRLERDGDGWRVVILSRSGEALDWVQAYALGAGSVWGGRPLFDATDEITPEAS